MFEQPIPVVTATLLLNALNSLWRSKVNGIVIEPYLVSLSLDGFDEPTSS